MQTTQTYLIEYFSNVEQAWLPMAYREGVEAVNKTGRGMRALYPALRLRARKV